MIELEKKVYNKFESFGLEGLKRYQHSLDVAKIMLALASENCFNEKEEIIYSCGLLHDYAKFYTKNNFLSLGQKYPEIQEFIEAPEKILHALLGPIVISEELGITDKSILSAIKFHSTAYPNLSPLGELLFVSDFLSKNKTDALLYNLAHTSLKKAIKYILNKKIDYLKNNEAAIYHYTIEAYEYYKKF